MVSVLFARTDSIYKTIENMDVWDAERDARRWLGGNSCIAHPPCRAWGRLRHFARPRSDEKELAIWAVAKVRENGGVLEHPFTSTLWHEARLPQPGRFDSWGGWTLPVLQQWFGHRAEKATLLYIVGCTPQQIPDIPFVLGEATHVVQSRRRCDYRPHITKPEREHTPLNFAKFLIQIATRGACNA
jgi:hypothetical protein